MDRYPYYKYTILLGATRALAHIGIHFTHRVSACQAFSGPRDGLLSNRRPLTRIQAWTSTSISQATRRQRNLFLLIILKNQALLLKPTPPLPRLFRLLTLKSLDSSQPRLLYFSSCMHLFFFVGPGAQDTCSLFFNEYSHIYIYIYIYIYTFFFIVVCVSAGSFHAFLYELHDLSWVYELSN